MTGLLAELGTKLIERWIALLVLPGVLYVGAVIVAVQLGHAHAIDGPALQRRLVAQSGPA